MIEAGRRFEDEDLPKPLGGITALWAPALGCYGIQRIHLLPTRSFWPVLGWAGIAGLRQHPVRYLPLLQGQTVGPHHRQQSELAVLRPGKRMLGVVQNRR